jgi:hypothetical protein
MPWQVKAEGHALSEAAEKKLFRLLAKLFRNEDYGAAGPIQFTGDHVNGNPMSDDDLAVAKSLSGDDDEEEPKAGLVPKGEGYPTQVAEPVIRPEDDPQGANRGLSYEGKGDGGSDEGADEEPSATEHDVELSGTMKVQPAKEEDDSDNVGDRG